MRARLFIIICITMMVYTAVADEVQVVSSESALLEAVRKATPGAVIGIEQGEYNGGLYIEAIHGAPDRPIHIKGMNPNNPPIFRGGTNGIHFSSISHVVIEDIHFTETTGNGLNIDDGGTFDTPSHHIVLRRVMVSQVGPEGNRDGIKLSGVQDFVLDDCTIEFWGDAGQGVDMVGCKRGLIENSKFRHRPDVHAAGIQTKGGTRDIHIRHNYIEGTARGINIGGSTSLAVFRPEPQGFEAKDILVEGNLFIRTQSPVAFVGVDGAVVRNNTLYHPGRWALRILQENQADGFVPCRNGVFSDNIVVFRSSEWAHGGVNIGPHTAVETFAFARNVWFCEDNPSNSTPSLPTAEEDGLIGVDPMLNKPSENDYSLHPISSAQGRGHTGLIE